MVAAFREGGGEGKPLYLKVGLSYAATDELALTHAHQQWRSVAFPNHLLTELRTPAEFDAAGERVRPEDMHQNLRVSGDIHQHIEWIRQDMELGFSQILLHNIGVNQEEFIDVFGEKVLPHF